MNTTPQSPGTGTGTSDTEKAKTAAEDLGNEARATAQKVGSDLAGKAREQAEAAKAGAADEISSVSKALRRATEELRDGSPQERTFAAAADAIADLADSVRDRDLGQMVDELGDFARRNPMGFLGGAALLGFAGVRLAKASRRARHGEHTPATSASATSAHLNQPGATGARPTPTASPTSSPATRPGAPSTPTGGTS